MNTNSTQPLRKVDLSICLVTLNTKSYIKNCLDSLIQNTATTYEIIVVDNSSTDGTLNLLRDFYPCVQLISNESNHGYTSAMNQALRIGTGRYLVQLNPDTVIQLGGFTNLLEYTDNHPEVGICTPKILNGDGSLQMQCRRSAARPWDVIAYFSRLWRLFPKNKRLTGYLMPWLPEDEVSEVEAVSGSCMFIRREVIDTIGYLDEEFFAYQEDADYCFRARQKGWKVAYIPLSEIIHFGGLGGSRHQAYKAIFEWHRSYFRYYRKHLARDYFFLINWLMYAAMAAKLILSLFVNLFRGEKIVGTPKPGHTETITTTETK